MPIAHVLRAVLATLSVALGIPLAHAEIYTWVDASGVTNVSNLPPPDGVKVTKIQRALPPDIVAREDAAREAARQSEARARQLEDETIARSMPPPDFRPVMAPPPPPVIQYIIQAPQPPMQQTVEVTQAPYGGYGGYGYGGYGCDPSWAGCALSWYPGFYPASVIVVPANNFRHVHPVRGNGNNNVVQPRLPPPFGPPLVPNMGPPFSPKLAGQQSMRSPASSGLRRS